jgi:hypothetical protein
MTRNEVTRFVCFSTDNIFMDERSAVVETSI